MRKFNVRWWAGPKLSQWRMLCVLCECGHRPALGPKPFAFHGRGWVKGFGNPMAWMEPFDVQEGGQIRLMQ